ncbi:YchJ family protein [Shewanella sp. AS16]|uniref:YchJ family protein n=1 Tax=Shewanella sp. AS16 TaxID=2907625 RepID=UPI001F2107DD|nr:YchJ family protein [Shewanella sp. AS16]MCE9687684.1 YchJ family protein [Shewanella sp. AS16]
MINPEKNCPCGTGKSYGLCCQPFHSGDSLPQTPEQLMRSRYAAFALKKFDYILASQHPEFLAGLTLAELAREPSPNWLGLDVMGSSQEQDRGEVSFKAWYRLDGRLEVIHEHSLFVREQGRWYYTQGEQLPAKLPGRNDPCVCHSGKKFKQCCARTA